MPWSYCPTIMPEGAAAIADAAANATANNTSVEPIEVPECADSSETQYYWYRVALDITGDIEDFDGIRW